METRTGRPALYAALAMFACGDSSQSSDAAADDETAGMDTSTSADTPGDASESGAGPAETSGIGDSTGVDPDTTGTGDPDPCAPSDAALVHAIDVSAGGAHTCAVLESGAVRCWGNGKNGQLGYGNTEDVGDDESIDCAGDVDVGDIATRVAAGGLHTCALSQRGTVRCWGSNTSGQLGYGHTESIGDDDVPAQAGDVDLGGTAVQITAGGVHTCALLDTGAVRCWGFGQYGRLGYGDIANIGDDETPASVGDVDVGGVVVQIDAGGSHTCAVLQTGGLRCWGFGNNGQLGYGGFVYPDGFGVGDDETPASVGDIDVAGATVSQVSAGAVHTCAVMDVGIRCWGANESSQGGPAGDFWEAAQNGNVPLDGTPVHVTAGAAHTCALLAGGGLRCWGAAGYGQLGYGSTDTVVTALQDVDVGAVVTVAQTGDFHMCVVSESGGLRCWGTGAQGRLGYGGSADVGDDETPADVGDVPVHE